MAVFGSGRDCEGTSPQVDHIAAHGYCCHVLGQRGILHRRAGNVSSRSLADGTLAERVDWGTGGIVVGRVGVGVDAADDVADTVEHRVHGAPHPRIDRSVVPALGVFGAPLLVVTVHRPAAAQLPVVPGDDPRGVAIDRDGGRAG